MNRGRIAAFILLAALLYTFPAGAEVLYFDDTDLASVEDKADLLTDDEKYALLSQAGNLADLTGMEFRVVTIDDAKGMATSEYAESYFEAMSELFSGGCYLLDLDNREYYVATYGDLRYYLTDDRIDGMISNAGSYARSSDWEGTLSSMLSDTESYIDAGIQDGTALYDQETGTYTYYEPPKAVTPLEALLSGSVGLLGFLAMFLTTKRRYQMKVRETNDYSFTDNVDMDLRVRNSLVTGRHVSRRLIPRDNDHHGGGGGGGHISSVHTTSGGHSAGGGGGHF